ARKEGKLTFVHTWRGKIARDFGSAFEKRYSYIKFEMSDLGSQDAAERFIAEERTGRHLTDILSLAVPDLAVILKQNLVARYPTPATNKILKQYRGFIDPENRWTAWYWSEHMLTGDHAVQGDNYLYAGIEALKKNPKTPYAIVYTAPILAFAGAMVINKNTQNPYAAALLADWSLSDEAQKLTSDVLRGPIAIKHPYLPDNIK